MLSIPQAAKNQKYIPAALFRPQNSVGYRKTAYYVTVLKWKKLTSVNPAVGENHNLKIAVLRIDQKRNKSRRNLTQSQKWF